MSIFFRNFAAEYGEVAPMMGQKGMMKGVAPMMGLMGMMKRKR